MSNVIEFRPHKDAQTIALAQAHLDGAQSIIASAREMQKSSSECLKSLTKLSDSLKRLDETMGRLKGRLQTCTQAMDEIDRSITIDPERLAQAKAELNLIPHS